MLKASIITALAALHSCSIAPDEVQVGVGGTMPEDRAIVLEEAPAHYNQSTRGDVDVSLWVVGVWHTRPREVVVMEDVRPRPVDFSPPATSGPAVIFHHDDDNEKDEVKGIVGNVSAGLQVAEGTSWTAIWKLAVILAVTILAGWGLLKLRNRMVRKNGKASG